MCASQVSIEGLIIVNLMKDRIIKRVTMAIVIVAVIKVAMKAGII